MLPLIAALLMTATPEIPAPRIAGEPKKNPPPIGSPVVYKQLPDRKLKLFVSNPVEWKSGDKRPALVFFHGGGWTGGGPGVLNDQASRYSEKGIVCILVQYRVIQGNETPELCLRDAKSAMRWVRGHAGELGIDPDRIGAMGGSAGAHLSAVTALVTGFDEPGEDAAISARPQALILYNPVLDMGPGGYGYKRVGERYREFSPIHNIAPGAPPTLILCGTADNISPVKMLNEFKTAMEQAGSRCELRLYEGQPHGFYRKSESEGKYYNLTIKEIDDFLHSLGWLSSAAPIP